MVDNQERRQNRVSRILAVGVGRRRIGLISSKDSYTKSKKEGCKPYYIQPYGLCFFLGFWLNAHCLILGCLPGVEDCSDIKTSPVSSLPPFRDYALKCG